jgi:hypothetical protein
MCSAREVATENRTRRGMGREWRSPVVKKLGWRELANREQVWYGRPNRLNSCSLIGAALVAW